MHHQGFDRLISAMDEVAGHIDEQVVMQVGAASYIPTHAAWFRFADGDRMNDLMGSARLVVAHAGAGTIITAFRYKRPLIVVPRSADQNEHVDNHQIDLAQALADKGKVYLVLEPSRAALQDAILQAKALRTHTSDSHRLAAAVSNILLGAKSKLSVTS